MLTPARRGGHGGRGGVATADDGVGGVATADEGVAEPGVDDEGPVRRRSPEPRSPLQWLKAAHRWFRAFRRTRPFWGGVWMLLGGWRILSYALTPLHFISVSGFNALSGWIIGGGLMACGLVSVLLPAQRVTFGVIGMLLAVVSLVASNLGGFFVGMLLGVVGSSMTIGWGVKKPRRRDRRRAARPAEQGG